MEAHSKKLVYNFDDAQISKSFHGYLCKPSRLILYDDLKVICNDLNSTLWMLRNFGIEYITERLTVDVTQKEVLDLLKFSLWSKTPVTDLFLHKKLNIQNSQTLPQSKLKISEVPGKEGMKMKLKVMMSKSKCKILFAQAEEDFTDQILGFLSVPLGAVEHLAQGNSGFGCIDNLYKSLASFDSTRDFNPKFLDLKKKLLNPLIACRRFLYQMLPIYKLHEPSNSPYFVHAKWGTTLMADDLSVKPFSSSAALSLLRESKAVEDDLEVRDINIGVNEVFEILKAAMFSSSALTTGLRPFLNVVKEEK